MDYSTHAGAFALADRIRDYWASLGYRGVKTAVVVCEAGYRNLGDDRSAKIYGVRSNIAPWGFPPKETAA